MTRLGRQIRSTVSKNDILQSLDYRGGCAPPTSRCRDFFISRTLSAFQFERLARFDVIVEGADVDFCCFHHIIKGILKDLEMSVIVDQ